MTGSSSSSGDVDGRSRLPYHLFQVGTLRFGGHGMGGIVCAVLTEACRRHYYYYHHVLQQQQQQHSSGTMKNQNNPLPSLLDDSTLLLLLASSQVLNFILATHAATLLPQVPRQTQIVPGIVAPHREAFVRTMGMMQYLVVRVVLQVIGAVVLLAAQQNETLSSMRLLLHYVVLVCLAIPYFARLVPSRQFLFGNNRTKNMSNGNTWIFVLPIWLGTTGDWVTLALLGCDKDVIRLDQLLKIQLVGLGLAFGFTLAFRNYVPMPVVYAVAAWYVWDIIREGYVTISGS